MLGSRRGGGWRPSRWQLVVIVVGLAVSAGTLFYVEEGSTAGDRDARAASTGSISAAPTSFQQLRTVFLAVGSSYVDVIGWNENGDDLRGSAQEVVAVGTAPGVDTTSETFQVSGRLEGASISLNFNHGPRASASVSGGSFTIDFPQDSGALAPIEFHLASSAQYDTALGDLNQRVDEANLNAENAQELQQEEQAINHDARIVSNEITSLSQDEAATSSFVGLIHPTLDSEANDLARTYQADQQVAAESGTSSNSKTCGNATGVATDAAQVANDDSSVAGDSGGVEASLSTVNGLRADVVQLQAGYSQLQQDEDILPDYTPAGTPSQSEVTSALAEASSSTQSSLSTTNGYIDQANAEMTSAFLYVVQAYQAGDCGLPATAPPPAQHIS